MEVTRNIAYRSKGHDRLPSGSHCLDIVRPEGVCDGEMVVFIHGGGWLTGDKGDIFTNPTVPEFFARNGKIFVSVNFRLAQMSSSHVLYQEQADDIASALAWLCENAARFGADGRKITLFGFSSGAHLASLIALDERYLGRHRLDTGIIKSVVAADVHAYDIPAVIRLMRDSSFSERIQLLTRLFGKARRDQLDASPINYVTNPVKKRFLLISVGMKERRNQPFTKEISRSFKSRLETCRHQAAHYHLENRSHESLLRQFGAPGDRFQSILLRFLEAQDNVTDSTTEETTCGCARRQRVAGRHPARRQRHPNLRMDQRTAAGNPARARAGTSTGRNRPTRPDASLPNFQTPAGSRRLRPTDIAKSG